MCTEEAASSLRDRIDKVRLFDCCPAICHLMPADRLISCGIEYIKAAILANVWLEELEKKKTRARAPPPFFSPTVVARYIS